MEIVITGKHIDVTDPIKQYALDKAGKLERYFDGLQQVEVLADKLDGRNYKVELVMHVAGHEHLVAHSKGEDLYACIDECNDRAERQLTDHKEKLHQRKHSGSRG